MLPKRILVVDDEPLICQSVTMMLDCDRHRAETARDGTEALAKFDSEHFDVVLTDYFMPGMRGDQLARAIKERNPSQPVILLTAFPPTDKRQTFDLILLKPFSLDNLRDAISQVT